MGSLNPLLSEIIGSPLPGPSPTSLYDLLEAPAVEYPDRTALVCMHQHSSFLSSIFTPQQILNSTHQPKYLRWTFAQLASASHIVARGLAASGIKPGMRIAAFIANGVEIHVLLRAALELGCTFAPFAPRLVGNEEEARFVLGMVSPAVILAQDESVVEKLEKFAPESMNGVVVKLFSSQAGNAKDGVITTKQWQNFESFVEDSVAINEEVVEKLAIERKADDVVLLLMTSGTTKLPKGCPHTNESYVSMCRSIVDSLGLDDEKDNARSSLCHIPVSHAFGANFSIAWHGAGRKVVHPAAVFDAVSSVEATRLERCSDIPAVPAVVNAMVAVDGLESVDTSCVKFVRFGATTTLPELIKISHEKLGALKAAEGYGMTETGPCLSPRWKELPTTIPVRHTCGPVVKDSKIRICVPDSNGEVVKRGEPGEVHVGGLHIIKEYWVGATERSKTGFYSDEGGLWIRTGDKGVMHEDGAINIVGRYKDMIIRGGENISPIAIESVLFSRFDLQAEVVGLPDEFAGEVPVAIVKRKPGQIVDLFKVKEILMKELGSAWVPDEILDVESLGISDYPRAAAGKVQKFELRKMLLEQRKSQANGINGNGVHPPVSDGHNSDKMLETLTKIWTKLLGIGPDTLTPDSLVHDWADSLTLARFSALLYREVGRQMNLQELSQYGTLSAQAKYLLTKGSSNMVTDTTPTRSGPPTADDMVHCLGDEAKAKQTEEKANQTLAPFGLSWNDVEDVIPMNDFQAMFTEYKRPQTWNHRHAWVCPGSTIDDVRKAVEGAVAHHNMLRTMCTYFDPALALHLTIRPTSKWFSRCITVVDSIETADDIKTLKRNDLELDFAAYPGPFARFMITHIKDQNCAGLIYNLHHSVFDAISLRFFLEDMEILLTDPSATIRPHVPYKLWADNYYNFQNSAHAQSHVDWHVKNLGGLSKNPATLFPIQRAPEWFKGSSIGWIDTKTGKPGPPRKSIDADPVGATGILRPCVLPDLQALRSEKRIDAYHVFKAALAVMTTKHTKQPYAIVAMAQAGRTWPFLADWQVDRMAPAMDVDGPAVLATLAMVHVRPENTVLEMLSTLQEEQLQLNKHAYAPKNQLLAALNAKSEGDGDFWLNAATRQAFNWLPTAPNFPYEKLKNMQIESRSDLGILWNFILLNQQTVVANVTWDDAQLGKNEIEGMLGEILRVAVLFSKRENWSKTIGSLI